MEQKIIYIETETGKRLLLTGRYSVMTKKGWVCANDLNTGVRIMGADGKVEKLKGLYMIPYNKKVYNLQLKRNDLQLIAEGIIVSDFMK